MITKYRDIQLIIKDQDSYLAIACDISAAIGPKDQDVVKVNNEMVGYYTAAVPIIELLAIGARPLSVVDTLGVEMHNSGLEIIEGIKKAMNEAHIDDQCLTGSTEDNMPTEMTSCGITVIGELSIELLDQQQAQSGQGVYLIGLPKVGQQLVEEEILGHKGEVISISLVRNLRSFKQVGHLLPVGSKGISYELKTMMDLNQLEIIFGESIEVDLKVSAGPATCMIMTCWPEDIEQITKTINIPIHELGRLK